MFDASVHAAWSAHAIHEFPHEACGLVIASAAGPTYVPCRNVAAATDVEFEIAAEDFVAASLAGEMLAVLHSHVPTAAFPIAGMPYPSKADMVAQEQSGLPFGLSLASADSCSEPIYFGDQVPMRDLVGRPYVYGVWDCYTLVRDHYRSRPERPFTLPIYPRDDGYWRDGTDLYGDHFAEAGFRIISPSEARAGDACLMRIRSTVANHAVVILDGGLMLHHLDGHLSAREPLARWLPFVTGYLRHEADF